MAAVEEQRRLLDKRVIDALFIFQIVVNIVVLGALVALLFSATRDIATITEQQVVIVQQQNEAQLCAQHEIVVAVRKIGVKLGLPVEDIVPPDVEGLDCAT